MQFSSFSRLLSLEILRFSNFYPLLALIILKVSNFLSIYRFCTVSVAVANPRKSLLKTTKTLRNNLEEVPIQIPVLKLWLSHLHIPMPLVAHLLIISLLPVVILEAQPICTKMSLRLVIKLHPLIQMSINFRIKIRTFNKVYFKLLKSLDHQDQHQQIPQIVNFDS